MFAHSLVRRPIPARFLLPVLASLACAAALAGPARCQSLVTSRAALTAPDPVDWAALGDSAFPLGDPLRASSAAGAPVSVTQAGGGPFGTVRQAGAVKAEGTLNGNFAPGAAVLYAPAGGAVSLSFPNGIYGGGAQLALPTQAAGGAGAFTVRVQAFGRDGAALASFVGGGAFSARGDDSAPFLGIAGAAPDIYRLSYTGLSPHSGLFLNRFDIATRPVAPAPSRARLLWTNPDGRAMLWSVSPDGTHGQVGVYGPYAGGGAAPATTIGGGPGDPTGTWKALALATGPNGVSRLLWTNPDGRATLWYVNADGGRGVSGTYGPYADAGGVWKALAVSVGPDNVAHVLWTHPDGRAVLWFVNPDGSFGDRGAYGPFRDGGGLWQAGALATGPDGVSRLLWTHPDGRAVLWSVSPAGAYTDKGAVGPFVDAGGVWRASAVSVGPDSVAHLLWTSPDGRAVLWFVNPDGSYGDRGAYGPYADGGGLWRAGAVATGPDGVSRLLWGSPDGRAVLWSVSPGGAYTDKGAYGPFADAGGLWRATADAAGP